MKTLKIIAVFGFAGVASLLLSSYGSLPCRAEEMHQMQATQEKVERACGKCGMNIEQNLKTAVRIEYKDGTSEEYCGVGCSLKKMGQKGGSDAVKSAQVTGWTSQQPLGMKDAVYVTGSALASQMGTRIIAFESKGAAEAFVKDKGGNIESFDSLLVSISQQAKK